MRKVEDFYLRVTKFYCTGTKESECSIGRVNVYLGRNLVLIRVSSVKN